MASLINRLLGGKPLTNIETWVVNATAARMPARAGERLKQQLAAINHVERHSDGKEINLDCRRLGKQAFPEAIRFLDHRDESRLATVVVTHPNGPQRIKAEVWLSKGYLYTIGFSRPPDDFFSGIDPASLRPGSVEVKILYDPSAAPSAKLTGSPNGAALTGWVREWHAAGQVSETRPPLSQAEREKALRQIDAGLPADYIALITQTNGAVINKWVIARPAEVRSVTLSDNMSYCVLAECDKGMLAVEEGSRSGRLFFFLSHSEVPVPAGDSLRTAINRKW